MARFWVIAAVVAVAFMIYAFVDCAMADRLRVRGPRKPVWLLIILLIPVIGAILWFVIGRGRSTDPAVRTRPVAPDDDPEFLARLRRESAERERLDRLEREFTDSDPDSTDPQGPDQGGTDPEGDGGTSDPDRRDA